jgi:hypothetical protein
MNDPERKRRLSISKSDLESGAAAELVSLIEDITADGKVSDEEARMLHEWLEDRDLSTMPGIAFLRGVMEAVLQDGHIDDSERIEIYKAVEKVLPVELRRQAKERRAAALVADKLEAKKAKEENRLKAWEDQRKSRPVASFDVMVAGCSYRPNANNEHAKAGIGIVLTREPSNSHDSNAVMVLTTAGHQLGYIPRGEAAEVAPLLDKKHRYSATVKKVVSGRTCNIPVVLVDIYSEDSIVEGLRVSETAIANSSESGTSSTTKAASGCGCGGCASVLLGLAALVIVLILLRT